MAKQALLLDDIKKFNDRLDIIYAITSAAQSEILHESSSSKKINDADNLTDKTILKLVHEKIAKKIQKYSQETQLDLKAFAMIPALSNEDRFIQVFYILLLNIIFSSDYSNLTPQILCT